MEGNYKMETMKIIPRNLDSYGVAFLFEDPIPTSEIKELLRMHGLGLSVTRGNGPYYNSNIIIHQIDGESINDLRVNFNDWIVIVDNEATSYSSYTNMMKDFTPYNDGDKKIDSMEALYESPLVNKCVIDEINDMKQVLRILKLEKIANMVFAKYNINCANLSVMDMEDIRTQLGEMLLLSGIDI